MNNDIFIFDSTLRDGAQGEGISFSVQDKLNIVRTLDELGVAYVEAGNPGSNPKDLEFFQEARKLTLENARLVAFGATRRKGIPAESDAGLQSLLSANTEYVAIFGKTWNFHVREILRASLEENLLMICESIEFLKKNERRVIYDAEHFFDGYIDDPEYAILTLQAAVRGGAEVLALCDTNGGTLPDKIEAITARVVKEFPDVAVGIHAHNDAGLAVANSLAAVRAGATQTQGTLIGFGERTGNANLSSVIANLELKMGLRCLPENHIAFLTGASRRVAEIANITLAENAPYVGYNAFAHKAGMHIDAVTKNTAAYEHVAPESVGNERIFLMSEVAGRSMIIEKIRRFDPSITKDAPVAAEIVRRVKDLEHQGYQFEGADGSFELLTRKCIGKYQPFFILHYYKTLGEQPAAGGQMYSYAQLKIEVEGQTEITAGEGAGPVHALDTALRKALTRFYPTVAEIRLTDYKVRVIDSANATAARVRVLIESTDGEDQWTTVGVSSDVIEASWLALVDSFEYKLIKDVETRYKAYMR